MRVSLNIVKKYVDLDAIDTKKIAEDLTLRTVEVEHVENTKDKFNNIVVGKINKVLPHPNADSLRICMVDTGEGEDKQIVCGGSNLYEGEYVVVSKPGAYVYWHGEGEPVEIKETKLRGESSYGMICASSEVYLDKLFPTDDDHIIVDLKGIECKPGDNIADVLGLNDTVLEIDNKSLTNRPDLWGHYGIARELSAIYNKPLKELNTKVDLPSEKYDITIESPEKCMRYTGTLIEGIENKPSPMWMQASLVNLGQKPINAMVDITNYVMFVTGQPSHAFDSTHVGGNKIVVRNAKKGEVLDLLDHQEIELTEDDLVICDEKDPMCLAGIRGGVKDSILEDTKNVLLEIASFDANTVRASGKRFVEKTDSMMRYEKGIDTFRIDPALAMSLELVKEIFPNSKITAFNDVVKNETKSIHIDVPKEFLDIRLGQELSEKQITEVLTNLGYKVEFDGNTFKVDVPVWRSTGDVSIKDDVLGDIARLLSFDYFTKKPLPVNFTNAVNQPKMSLERKIKEYFAFRCGFNEVFTYPWVDEKYIKAAKMNTEDCIKLSAPPAPELENLRGSLIPGMLEVISKNTRFYEDFKVFEIAQAFSKGKYHPSSEDETLPIHTKYLTGAVVGKNAEEIFFEAKGAIESMASITQMKELTLNEGDKPSWADKNAYVDILINDEVIGKLGLLSISTLNDAKIKHTNVAIFEINIDKLEPNVSRDNKYTHLPLFPLVQKDLSLLCDEGTTWDDIKNAIGSRAKEIEFIEEYRGEKIPEGKKSIVLRVKIDGVDKTLTTEEIQERINGILNALEKNCNAHLREE